MKTRLLIAVFICIVSNLRSQIIPELVFQNPTLQSGTAGANGAQYKFSNVAPGYYAIVQIVNRSSPGVTIASIDSVGIGYTKAWQPVCGMNGSVAANQSWWVHFTLSFYSNTTNSKVSLPRFYATGLDIDGDGGTLNEWVEMDKLTGVEFSAPTSLGNSVLGSNSTGANTDLIGTDVNIQGPSTNYANIDTLATAVMATYQFDNKKTIDIVLGANSGSNTTTAGMRMNSVWFRHFNLPGNVPLPVKLLSFNAMLNNNNQAQLHWTTTAEVNFSHFTVEKSTDGKNYSQAGVVFAAGNATDNTSYSLNDNLGSNPPAVIYYRLNCVDADGKSTYSETRIIRTGKQITTMNIQAFPNPATTNIRVTVPASWQNKAVTFEIYSAAGQLMSRTQTGAASQTETINLSNLTRGYYVVKAVSGSEVAQQSVIKN